MLRRRRDSPPEGVEEGENPLSERSTEQEPGLEQEAPSETLSEEENPAPSGKHRHSRRKGRGRRKKGLDPSEGELDPKLQALLDSDDPEKEGEKEDEEDVSVLSMIGTIVWSVAIVAFIGIILASFASAMGVWRAETILSGSMLPKYPPGSMVLAFSQDANRIAPGQIIIFHAPVPPHELVTHRIIGVEGGFGGQPIIQTKGDNNKIPDPWKVVVSTPKVWIVHGDIPYVGWVSNWAITWWPVLVGFIIALPLASFASNQIKEAHGWRQFKPEYTPEFEGSGLSLIPGYFGVVEPEAERVEEPEPVA